MDIGEIVGNAIRYPSQDWKKFIIFAVIMIISMILSGRVGIIGGIIGIIVSFLMYGYILRVIKATLAGSDELPEFEEWGTMFIDGLKVFLVGFVYSLPATIITIVSATSLIAAAYFGTGITMTEISGLLGVALIGMIVAFLYMLLVAFPLFIIAIANMAYYDGELMAAFRFSEILNHISRIGWADFIIWYIVMIIISIVAAIVGVITIIGWIIIFPYLYLFLTRSLGLLVGETAGK